ncbi:MAG: restriction endonuclease subunit S [Chloroflexota bacterium]|nr:MAG: restriction endonuclease subunit S [Chloroflexota bacterium]
MSSRSPLAACQRFGESDVPSGWVIEPIRERIWLEYGAGLVESQRVEGPYPVYGSNGAVGSHTEFMVSGPGILVGRKGSVGAVHFSERAFWPIDTVYYVRRKGEDSWKYLFYLLSYLRLDRLNAATGLPGLSRRDAHLMLGVFPPLDEQQQMVSALDMCDEAMGIVSRQIGATQRVKAALMQQLFTKGVPGRHSKYKSIVVFRRRVDFPATWEASQLRSNVTRVEYGTNAPSNEYKAGYPVIAIPQVVASRLELGDVPYADLTKAEANALRLEPDDVLLIRTNGNPDYIGKSTVVTSDVAAQHVVFASYLIRVRTEKTRLLGAYLNYFLASPLGRRQAMAMANTSAGNHNLGARSLKQFWLPLPEKDEQQDIVETLNRCEDTVDALGRKLKSLEELKQALLQNLLTGKVRVNMEALV